MSEPIDMVKDPTRGERGSQGNRGRQGERGNQGNRGNPGEQGKTGTPGGIRITDKRVLLIFLVVVVVGLYLFHNQSNITQAQQMIEYQRCADSAKNTVQANKFGAAMADLERHNQFIRGPIRTQRVRLYEALIFPVPKCGKKPSS